MSAEDILDKWFGGPANSKKENPRNLLKELPPVSLQGRRDYSTSIELGNKRGTKLELKYPSWGLYPRYELQELLTMLRIDFISQAIVIYEKGRLKSPVLGMSEAVKQKLMVREKSYQDFLSKKPYVNE